jgi:dihydropteroate synthase
MLCLEELAELADRHRDALAARVASFELGGLEFGGEAPPQMMGVINLSRDSWYRESVALDASAAVRRGRRLVADGAAIVDVGAESTLAHAARADAAAQIAQLIPVVRALAAERVLVSVETYELAVARAALEAGALVLNLTGTQATEEMYHLAAAHDAGVIICFVQGDHVRAVGDLTLGGDPVETMRGYFARELERATRAGVKRLWIDGGLGFYYRNLEDSAARVRYQLQAFLHTFRLRALGWPTCHALPHAFEYFEDEVRTAEAFFAVLAVIGKTDLLRTHEVAKIRGVTRALAAWSR